MDHQPVMNFHIDEIIVLDNLEHITYIVPQQFTATLLSRGVEGPALRNPGNRTDNDCQSQVPIPAVSSGR